MTSKNLAGEDWRKEVLVGVPSSRGPFHALKTRGSSPKINQTSASEPGKTWMGECGEMETTSPLAQIYKRVLQMSRSSREFCPYFPIYSLISRIHAGLKRSVSSSSPVRHAITDGNRTSRESERGNKEDYATNSHQGLPTPVQVTYDRRRIMPVRFFSCR